MRGTYAVKYRDGAEVCAWRRCGLLPNYFGHLVLVAVVVVILHAAGGGVKGVNERNGCVRRRHLSVNEIAADDAVNHRRWWAACRDSTGPTGDPAM